MVFYDSFLASSWKYFFIRFKLVLGQYRLSSFSDGFDALEKPFFRKDKNCQMWGVMTWLSNLTWACKYRSRIQEAIICGKFLNNRLWFCQNCVLSSRWWLCMLTFSNLATVFCNVFIWLYSQTCSHSSCSRFIQHLFLIELTNFNRNSVFMSDLRTFVPILPFLGSMNLIQPLCRVLKLSFCRLSAF